MRKNIILEEILKKYDEELENTKDSDKVFEFFSAAQILKDEDFDSAELESGLIGGGNDNGIDGIFILLDNKLVNSLEEIESMKNIKILTIHFHQYKNNYKISEDVILKFNNAFQDILCFENSLKGWNEELKEKILLIRKVIMRTAQYGPEINFIIRHVSKGKKVDIEDNHSYYNKVKNMEEIIKKSDVPSINIDFDFIGSDELNKFYKLKPSYSLELSIIDTPLNLEFGNDNNIGYIAVVNLKSYYKFIVDDKTKKIKKFLFDANVRDFQNGTLVNKQIKETLINEKKIDFWWLNNGVTIIASKSNQVGKTLHLENVQIVNGLQTSFSIYENINNEVNENRTLLVKIIISKDQATIDKIIKATNSQNPVAPALLRATDSIQRDIEIYFRSNGYFYDRRKNYYKNQGKPLNKIISINFLSQCITSLLLSEKDPSKARSNPTVLIKRDEDYKKVFNVRFSYKAYLNSIIIVKKINNMIKEKKDELERDTLNIKELESILKYYKFHISRIYISFLLKISKYDVKEIENIDDFNPNLKKLSEVLIFLNQILGDYQSKEGGTLVNISKQTTFSQFITEKLSKKFQIKK